MRSMEAQNAMKGSYEFEVKNAMKGVKNTMKGGKECDERKSRML